MAGPGSLCHRCGSSWWETLGESRRRCAACGHEVHATRLVAGTDARAEQLPRRDVATTAHAFATAPFRPLGLDARWRGLRWFGGWGGREHATTRLELAHGDAPRDATAPQVRVATSRPGGAVELALARGQAARALVEHLWRETGELRDDVRRAAWTDRRDGDPTEPWSTRAFDGDGDGDVAVDGVELRLLAHGAVWVAIGARDGLLVTVQARGWPPERTGFVTVTDFGAYEAGSRSLG